jgi:hypothetical protein
MFWKCKSKQLIYIMPTTQWLWTDVTIRMMLNWYMILIKNNCLYIDIVTRKYEMNKTIYSSLKLHSEHIGHTYIV